MKSVFVLAALLIGLTATAAPAVYFPNDALREEQAQLLEQMKAMRTMLEAQQAVLQGVPAGKREPLMRENGRQIERMDRMIARAEEGQARKPAPYNDSRQLGSSLRSLFLRPY